jgi:hypothetical protein
MTGDKIEKGVNKKGEKKKGREGKEEEKTSGKGT